MVDEETCRTVKDRVWAGGDIVTGTTTVIAMDAGKRAAASIDAYLRG